MAITQIGTPNTTKYMQMVNSTTNTAEANNQNKTATYPPTMFDRVMEKVVNKRDIQDTVTMPRTIFKGYLGIMTGTSLLTIGANMTKLLKTSKALRIAGLILAAIGTFEFVKPFMIRGKELNSTKDKP